MSDTTQPHDAELTRLREQVAHERHMAELIQRARARTEEECFEREEKLRERLAEVERERDLYQVAEKRAGDAWQGANTALILEQDMAERIRRERNHAREERYAAEAKLAEVERERDTTSEGWRTTLNEWRRDLDRAQRAEARLATVRAAAEHLFAIEEKYQDTNEWQWALNEMTEEMIDEWASASRALRQVVAATAPAPDREEA